MTLDMEKQHVLKQLIVLADYFSERFVALEKSDCNLLDFVCETTLCQPSLFDAVRATPLETFQLKLDSQFLQMKALFQTRLHPQRDLVETI